MSIRSVILFLTFVLSTMAMTSAPEVGHASVGPGTLDLDQHPATEPEPEKAPELDRETIDIANPPAAAKKEKQHSSEYFYPYRKEGTVRIGQVTNSQETNGTAFPLLSGLQLAFTMADLKTFEAGADLLSDGTGALQLARRWVFARSELRPYTKAGVSLLVNPSDRLVMFVKTDNYRIEGAAGIEYLLKDPSSIRFEAEALLGLKAQQMIGTIGYVWAW